MERSSGTQSLVQIVTSNLDQTDMTWHDTSDSAGESSDLGGKENLSRNESSL